MIITIEHLQQGKFPSFNVAISSAAGKEPFITVKSCRIVDGQKGRFVSWPAKKLDSGKYFGFVWASEGFQAAVLAEHDKTLPKTPARDTRHLQDMDNDIPF